MTALRTIKDMSLNFITKIAHLSNTAKYRIFERSREDKDSNKLYVITRKTSQFSNLFLKTFESYLFVLVTMLVKDLIRSKFRRSNFRYKQGNLSQTCLVTYLRRFEFQQCHTTFCCTYKRWLRLLDLSSRSIPTPIHT